MRRVSLLTLLTLIAAMVIAASPARHVSAVDATISCLDTPPDGAITGTGLINGTNHADVIYGSDEADTINGKGGNDIICAGGGGDTVDGGSGNDAIDGEEGDDTLKGGSGNDEIFDADGVTNADGGTGNDFIEATGGVLNGGSGNDVIFDFCPPLCILPPPDFPAATILGGSGNDELYGGPKNDTLKGESGSDFLDGEGSDDVLDCGTGRDSYTPDVNDTTDPISCERVEILL